MSGSGVYYSGMFIIDSTWNHHISQVWTMDAGFAGPKLVGGVRFFGSPTSVNQPH